MLTFLCRKSLFVFNDGNAGTLLQIILWNECRTLAHFQNITGGEQRNKNSEIISKNFRRFLIILQRYLPSILNCGSIHHHRVNREIKDQKLFPKVFKRGILMGIRLQGYLQLGLNWENCLVKYSGTILCFHTVWIQTSSFLSLYIWARLNPVISVFGFFQHKFGSRKLKFQKFEILCISSDEFESWHLRFRFVNGRGCWWPISWEQIKDANIVQSRKQTPIKYQISKISCKEIPRSIHFDQEVASKYWPNVIWTK